MRALALDEDRLLLQCHYTDREIAKSIPGRRWDPRRRCWVYPLQAYTAIRQAFPIIRVPAEVQKAALQAMEREAALAETRAAGWEDAEPIEPMPIKGKPYRHQIAAYNLALWCPAAALLMEQGCGKTLSAIAAAGRRFLRGEVKRLLVVAPASVVPVWAKEFRQFADFPHEVHALVGSVKKRAEMLMNIRCKIAPSLARKAGLDLPLLVAVINYEATWRMEESLRAWEPDMIICDESQRIKTPGARQSKTMHRLGERVRYKLILTGTPVTQGPLDFFSQYRFLDRSIFGPSFYAFKGRYAVTGGYENRQIIGYKNLPELVRKAHSIAFRVTKAEALDLPEYTDQVLYCDLESKAKQIYQQLVRESVAELSAENVITAANVLSRLLRLSQAVGGYLRDDDDTVHQVSNAKLTLLDETVGDLIDAGKKVVIFARFLPEIEAIKQMLEKRKVDYAWITGERAMSERGEEVRRFQEDDDCRVFLAQIQTAGLGITLTAADTAIFYSLDFSFANYDQCRARIHRIGQKNACTYIHLVAEGTVDEKILDALQQKRSVADQIVDNWRQYFNGKDDKHG